MGSDLSLWPGSSSVPSLELAPDVVAGHRRLERVWLCMIISCFQVPLDIIHTDRVGHPRLGELGRRRDQGVTCFRQLWSHPCRSLI